MAEEVIGSENHDQEKKACEGNGHSQSKPSDANGNITSSEDGRSELNNNGITDKPFLFDREEDKTCNAEEDFEDSAGSEGGDMHVGESKRTEEEKQVQEEEHEIPAQKQIQEEDHGTSAEEQIQKEEREALVVEEQTQEDKNETSSASTEQDPSLTVHARAKRGSKRSEQVDKDSHANPVRSKSVEQHDKKRQTSTTVIPTRRSSRKSSATMRTRKVSNDEVGSHRRLRKPKELSVKLASGAFGCGKRKKLKWTEEEEEAIRAGVEKCSKESKSVPWRKILELRPRMFDATRTPADLKDKWRNMSGK